MLTLAEKIGSGIHDVLENSTEVYMKGFKNVTGGIDSVDSLIKSWECVSAAQSASSHQAPATDEQGVLMVTPGQAQQIDNEMMCRVEKGWLCPAG